MRYAGSILVVCIVLAGLCSCRKHDYRTALITVPGLKNAECAQRVIEAVVRGQGIPQSDIHVDLGDRTVTVRYNSLNMSLKNIEFNIAEAGFQANDVPADSTAYAALPAACR